VSFKLQILLLGNLNNETLIKAFINNCFLIIELTPLVNYFLFFCRVKLITNNSGEAVAVKIVDFHKHPDALQNLKKEVAIHRMTKHENIIHFFGHRRDNTCEYIFLEYASGGELFDRIGNVGCSEK
jgi:serine/threonine protein kinase